ncbi:MAG: hypothetical protein Q4D79_15190 [Propionibacteriaceae bacterium]|nr:hypothetical protein [Propionibacteriaceae bacterium]
MHLLDEVQLGHPEWRELLASADVAVARGRGKVVLAALSETQRSGVPVVDSAVAVEGVRDKRLMTQTMIDAGIPTPRTIVGDMADAAESTLAYPLIIKPVFGDNSVGLAVVEDPDQLSALEWVEPDAIVQEYRPQGGVDLKLYVIDSMLAAIRKPSPITPCTSEECLGLTELTPELRDLARRCREAFGLRFFGIDCLEMPSGQIQVLEVNDFPNYSLVPWASELLAQQVLQTVRLSRSHCDTRHRMTLRA